MTDEEITKVARAILREQEQEVLRRAYRECVSDDQVAKRMQVWRQRQ